MNDEEKAEFLTRFINWHNERSDAAPDTSDVYRFLETDR